jgi:membrane protein DedA with SNARE-associated domain
MSITSLIIEKVVAFISFGGYPSLIVLMAMESMILPLPSEAVMPFAGFLISEGKMTFPLVLLFSTIGSILGSLLSYYIGKYGGNPLLKRYGKYVLLNEEHLMKTEEFFGKYGGRAVFIGRLIPVVRHFISIPAGMANMKISSFLLYTTIGAALWNGFLAYVGFLLKNNWDHLERYTKVMDIIVVLGIFGFIIYFFAKRKSSKK